MESVKVIFLSIFLLVILDANAVKTNALCVYSSLNGKTYFLFDDLPKVEFENNSIIVSTNEKLNVLQFSNLQKVTFEEVHVDSRVNNVDIEQPMISLEGNTISVYNVNSDIFIYTPSGILVGKYSPNGQGYCKFNIESSGLYIINNKKFNFKIIL